MSSSEPKQKFAPKAPVSLDPPKHDRYTTLQLSQYDGK